LEYILLDRSKTSLDSLSNLPSGSVPPASASAAPNSSVSGSSKESKSASASG